MRLRYSFLHLLIALSTCIWAVAPTNYYTAANGKNTAELRTSLQLIITSRQSVPSYSGLYAAYATTDINPSTGKIWDMYSNCNFTYGTDENHGTSGPECTNYNREHTSPQSWFAEASPMVSDLFNVYPTDTKVNGIRSNYPYGEVGTASEVTGNGSKLGTSNFSGYTGVVFEPINEYKGDIARTCLYMAVRYAGLCESWSAGAEVVYGSNYGLTTYTKDLFLKWSRQDPVSAKEIARNDAVYAIQFNRNPFIDYPGTEELIWGNNTTATFPISLAPTAPTVINPSATNITTTTAILGGNISASSSNITEAGIYYSTTSGFANGTGTKVTATTSLLGEFTTNVSGLTPNTVYYYKAYAVNNVGTTYSVQGTFTSAALPTPVIVAQNVVYSGNTLSFGKVSLSATKTLVIKTSTLTGNLSVSVSGEMYSTSATTITKAEAEAGYNLTITYNPTNSGIHNATLSIVGGGLPAYTVELTGTK